MHRIFVGLVKFYQFFLSPLLPSSCRFVPSCSHYAVEAFERHGCLRGGLLTLGRLLRCHPLCRGGLDPVPPPSSRASGTRRGPAGGPPGEKLAEADGRTGGPSRADITTQ
jgi:putative membrane protein insertion efficiency factor